MRKFFYLKPFVLLIGLFALYIGVLRFNGIIYLQKQSLHPNTVNVIKQINQPVHLTLYSKRTDLYNSLLPFLYHINQQSHWTLNWEQAIPINVQQRHPYAQNLLQVSMGEQEKIIELNDYINENTILNLLLQILRPENRWVTFLSGHGEPSIHDTSKAGLSLFNLALTNQGFKTAVFDSTQMSTLPSNADFLIVVSSQNSLLPKEAQVLQQYLNAGHNMIFLSDPNHAHVLDELLPIEWLKGTVVDAHGKALGTPHPAITIIDKFAHDLPISPPQQIIALPWAKALRVHNHNWKNQPLLVSDPQSWTEHHLEHNQIELNTEQGEIQGPLLLGTLLTREMNQKEQHIAVIGNSRFIRNSAIQNYGNLTLAINLCNWLQSEPMIANTASIEPEQTIQLHFFTAFAIQYGFALLLLALAVVAGWMFYRRQLA